MLYEYGIVSAKGAAGLRKVVMETLDEQHPLPANLLSSLHHLWVHYQSLKEEFTKQEKTKNALVRQLEPCKSLITLEGVAEVCAAMLYSSLGNGKQFKNSREASAFVELTPKQHSSGGKVFMMGIDKKDGIKELKAALYQGAISIVTNLPEEPKTVKQKWLIQLLQRVGIKRTCVALANKTVRTAWAMLRYESQYEKQLLIER